MPKLTVTAYNLRHKFSHRPKLNSDRVKNSYFNRLIIKYDLAFDLYFGNELNKIPSFFIFIYFNLFIFLNNYNLAL